MTSNHNPLNSFSGLFLYFDDSFPFRSNYLFFNLRSTSRYFPYVQPPIQLCFMSRKELLSLRSCSSGYRYSRPRTEATSICGFCIIFASPSAMAPSLGRTVRPLPPPPGREFDPGPTEDKHLSACLSYHGLRAMKPEFLAHRPHRVGRIFIPPRREITHDSYVILSALGTFCLFYVNISLFMKSMTSTSWS